MARRRSVQCITLEPVFARTSVDGAKTQRVAFLADLFFIVFLAAFFPAAAFWVGLLILLAGRSFAPVLAAVFFPFLAAVVMAWPALGFLAEVVTRLTALLAAALVRAAAPSTTTPMILSVSGPPAPPLFVSVAACPVFSSSMRASFG